VVVKRAFGKATCILVECGQLTLDLAAQGWRQGVPQPDPLGPDRGAPTGAGLARGRVLQLQQVLDDRPDAVARSSLHRAAKVLDLQGQVGDVQLGETPGAQQVGLGSGPRVEIIRMEIGPCLDPGGHEGLHPMS
jgi:hypothetical protein